MCLATHRVAPEIIRKDSHEVLRLWGYMGD